MIKKYQDHVPCSFACKNVCVDDKFTKPIVDFRGQNAAYEFVKPFNKNLIISEEEEGQFQSRNTCWICEKLIDNGDHFRFEIIFMCQENLEVKLIEVVT